MVELAELVLRLLGLALPEKHSSANFFDHFMFHPSGNLRLLHYPPQTSTDEMQLGGKTSSYVNSLSFFLGDT
jgi:isopenicillin N synthase-like dioxygenase